MIVSPDKKGTIDPVVYSILIHIETDVPLVPITRLQDFKFNESLLRLDKYVIVDYSEFDWNFDWSNGTPMFGNKFNQEKFPGDEWKRFNDFVLKTPPVLTFQRELLAEDVTDTILPIEFPNWHPPFPIDTKEQYDARPIEVFNFWGHSHEDRVQLHSDIWEGVLSGGYSLCDNIYHLDAFMREQQGKKWVSLYMPHYSRVEIKNILAINGLSKLSLSLPGAGLKCFRSTGESGANSTIVMRPDELAWTYPFIDGWNCIKVKKGEEIERMKEALQYDDLYNIYLECINTTNKYYYPDYIKNYIKPAIEKAIS